MILVTIAHSGKLFIFLQLPGGWWNGIHRNHKYGDILTKIKSSSYMCIFIYAYQREFEEEHTLGFF